MEILLFMALIALIGMIFFYLRQIDRGERDMPDNYPDLIREFFIKK